MNLIKRVLVACLCLLSLTVFAAPVDINTASAEELAASLKGVGPAKAKLIVSYREANGPFKDAVELQLVKGIGEATVKKNMDNILIQPQETVE